MSENYRGEKHGWKWPAYQVFNGAQVTLLPERAKDPRECLSWFQSSGQRYARLQRCCVVGDSYHRKGKDPYKAQSKRKNPELWKNCLIGFQAASCNRQRVSLLGLQRHSEIYRRELFLDSGSKIGECSACSFLNISSLNKDFLRSCRM